MASGIIHNKNMQNNSVFKLEIKSANPAAFTLNSVVSSPRTCTPHDLASACQNVQLENTGQNDPPEHMRACLEFLLTEYFGLAHRTGLYNRQKTLWDSLGKVTTIEANRLQQGIFTKVELPFFDIHLKDEAGKTLIFAHLIEQAAYAPEQLGSEKREKEHFKAFLTRAEKLHSSKGPLTGLVLFSTAPFSNIVLTEVLRQVGGDDPVGRYESKLGDPLNISMDLIEYASDTGTTVVKLVQPDLTVSSKRHT